MPDLAGRIGLGLLLASVVLLAVAAVAVIPRAVRVRRRALALRTSVLAARHEALIALALLDAQRAETDELLVPWLRLRRWARHPLLVATLQWWWRRRAAARQPHE